MPVYEYECSACGHLEEVIQSFSDKPLTKCPGCSGKMSKLISQSAFHLKGSGWYVTDYSDTKKPPASPDKENSGKKKPESADSKKNKKKIDKKAE
jgi:putative FmdB family regulatory protein